MSEPRPTSDSETLEGTGLQSWLDAIRFDERFIVERTLKTSEHEVTQLVRYSHGPKGSLFVRKVFAPGGNGVYAYESIFRAQCSGTRFLHLPRIVECSAPEGSEAEVIMEHVPGDTLLQRVQRDGSSTALAKEVGPLLCDAATELHTVSGGPIIHRDIKPSNIILNNGGLTLIDLGIARRPRDGAQRDTQRHGTPGYAPPEQFGYSQTDVQSDVFAIGMVVAFCFTGVDPDEGLRLSGFNDSRIPPAFRKILAKATSFDPAERFCSAEELKAALQAAGAGRGEPSHIGKRIALTATALTLVCLAVLGIAIASRTAGPLPGSNASEASPAAKTSAVEISSASKSSVSGSLADDSSSAYADYQAIFDDYSARLQETAPTLVDEFNVEAKTLSGGANELAELSTAKIDALAEIATEGTGRMADLMISNGDSYDTYDGWAQKLYGVYAEQAQSITDAYLEAAV